MGIDPNSGTSLMRRKRVSAPVMVQVTLNNLGGNSLNRAEVEVVDMEAPALLISPRPPRVLNLIDDNYWVKVPSSLFQDQNQVNSRTLVNLKILIT